jgi:hypothetical protein
LLLSDIVDARYEFQYQDTCSRNCLIDCDLIEIKTKMVMTDSSVYNPYSKYTPVGAESECKAGAPFELGCELQYRRAAAVSKANVSHEFAFIMEHLG